MTTSDPNPLKSIRLLFFEGSMRASGNRCYTSELQFLPQAALMAHRGEMQGRLVPHSVVFSAWIDLAMLHAPGPESRVAVASNVSCMTVATATAIEGETL